MNSTVLHKLSFFCWSPNANSEGNGQFRIPGWYFHPRPEYNEPPTTLKGGPYPTKASAVAAAERGSFGTPHQIHVPLDNGAAADISFSTFTGLWGWRGTDGRMQGQQSSFDLPSAIMAYQHLLKVAQVAHPPRRAVQRQGELDTAVESYREAVTASEQARRVMLHNHGARGGRVLVTAHFTDPAGKDDESFQCEADPVLLNAFLDALYRREQRAAERVAKAARRQHDG